MATYFVKTVIIAGGSTPSDSNDGRDPIGFSMSNGFFDFTGGTVERMVTSTETFTSYVYNAGDQIYISGSIGGVANGLYEITSRVSDNAIGLAENSGLTSDATADLVASNGPWATCGKGTATPVAGDDVVICADGDHTPSTAVTFVAGRGGIHINPKRYGGGTARGVVDGTRATINGDNCSTGILYDGGNAAAMNATTFHDLILDGNGAQSSGGDGIRVDAAQIGFNMVDIKIVNPGRNGIHISDLLWKGAIIRMEISGATGRGVVGAAAEDGQASFSDCSIHDNSSHGIEVGQGVFRNMLIYDNGGDGIVMTQASSWGQFKVENCTIYGNTGDGISLLSTTNVVSTVIINNICKNNGGYGINLSGYNFGMIAEIGGNVLHNNTSGATSLTGSAALGATGIDKNALVASRALDPEFVSVTDGSEDFTPTSQSAVFAAGDGGGVPAGVSLNSDRKWHAGVVPPDLTAGGDGVGGGGGMIGG